MNRGSSVTAYVILMLAFVAALALGLLYFITGMHASSYVITDGIEYTQRFINKPRYDRNLLGMIYTLVFFVAGLLMLFIMAVPDERMLSAFRRAPAPPQPRRRRAAVAPAPAAAMPAAPAHVREAAPALLGVPSPAMELPAREFAQAAGLEEMEEAVPVPVAALAPAPAPAPKTPEVPVDIAAQQESALAEPPVDLPTARPELSGEEDVVYGNGPTTEDSIVEFIQNYPDSAVKFLYRKNLDNRPLPPMEEDIYQQWERRGMSRAKVRQYVLEIMGWEKLPDDFPHNIWMKLRDRIYELKVEIRARPPR